MGGQDVPTIHRCLSNTWSCHHDMAACLGNKPPLSGVTGWKVKLQTVSDIVLKDDTYSVSSVETLKLWFSVFCWWLIRVPLVVGLAFCPKILDPWWGPTNAICCFVNVDGEVLVLGSGGDTTILHVVWTICTNKWGRLKNLVLHPHALHAQKKCKYWWFGVNQSFVIWSPKR